MREAARTPELMAIIGTSAGQPEVARVSVALAGEFDAYDLESLRQVLEALLKSRGTACVGLSRVTFLDLRCARELASRSDLCGGRLTLQNPSWQAASSLRACGLKTRIAPPTSDIYSSVDKASKPKKTLPHSHDALNLEVNTGF